MIVIPAIDIISSRVVRLEMGDYSSEKEYSSDPLEMAKRFEDTGLRHLHLVDLDGAKSGEPKNLKVLERIASKTELSVDFGGGIKTLGSLESALSAGAREVSVGSVAAKNKEQVFSWLDKYKDRMILSADCRNRMISVSGWKEETGIEVISFIREYFDRGLEKVISTDISRDGMLSGPAFDLYSDILKSIPDEKVIVSGGISSIEDVYKCASIGCHGVIVGKAYYEQKVTLKQLKEAEDAC